VLDAAGTHHVLEVTAVNLLSDPDIAGIVITSRNVTDERANRAELTALRDEAVAEADQRSRLVATVSHELRNPLHAVTGLSELLVSDPALPTSLHDLASTLHRQVKQLKLVTDDLLDAAQLEIGDASLRAGPTRVRRIVEDVARLGRAAQSDKPVAVWASVDEHVPAVVHTDAGRLHQLLLNLVGNAVKFTDAGEVGISVTATEQEDGLRLHIAVRDTGRGIPPDDLDKIFEPFLMASTAGDQGGAGLGLAVASRIVDRLGGSIDVASEVDRGTTFDVSFPVGLSDEPIEVARLDPTESTDRPTILVVEDNAVNQELARHQLARLGAAGVVVATAEEAIELAVDGEFDAILMDHQLPGMNGRDATRELRRLGVTTPIIGMTASATAADEQACLDAGMDAFLAKPVGLDQLGAALAAHIARDHRDTATSEGDTPGEGDADAAVDVATLSTLADELGDPAIVEALVTTFLGELERRRAAIAEGDPELVAREAHTLKSSARLLGAFQLATICEQVETDPSRAPLVDDHATAAARAFRSWLRDRPQEETQ
jgi:signal transduction histidine kinase/DNA-binding NarL/FixJ family response regulator